MKKKLIALFLTLATLVALTSCGKKAPTWQEQYDLGVKYLSEGSYEEAILAFTAAIGIDANNAAAYVGRGDAYLAMAEALEATDPAAALEACKNARADYEKALDLVQSGKDTSGSSGGSGSAAQVEQTALQAKLDRAAEKVTALEAVTADGKGGSASTGTDTGNDDASIGTSAGAGDASDDKGGASDGAGDSNGNDASTGEGGSGDGEGTGSGEGGSGDGESSGSAGKVPGTGEAFDAMDQLGNSVDSLIAILGSDYTTKQAGAYRHLYVWDSGLQAQVEDSNGLVEHIGVWDGACNASVSGIHIGDSDSAARGALQGAGYQVFDQGFIYANNADHTRVVQVNADSDGVFYITCERDIFQTYQREPDYFG